ncbi:hypothetical protein evm_014703 [Chilo suppressalis]|nr:hypothetical protein evm_014703 [Chilo suppressalis]
MRCGLGVLMRRSVVVDIVIYQRTDGQRAEIWHAVPYVTKCKADDAACIKSSAQAMVTKFVDGIPELGVEKMDPMNLKKPIDASSPGLKVILKDLVVTGLRDCNIQSMSRDAAKNKLFAKILCDAVNTVGQYEMDGKLIVLQVSGKGKITTVLSKYRQVKAILL